MNLANKTYSGDLSSYGLDPLFWAPAKVPNTVFFIGSQHPLRIVELVRDHIDDGTGVIACVWFTSHEEQEEPELRQTHKLGTSVRVHGRLSEFRGERQVVINTLDVVGPNEETLGWLERLSLRSYLKKSSFK
ncbi:hypothetical protein DL89DRAFT_294447 [Linderina pennispora]|uniref:CST complex subunit STN1 n=1 Tax=Linderina pennispora TaxID=61395 RepID=A0A1Y1W2Z2_9FUNG|nr:uncharacterized protein DL89DRAFT_294447 [Linderina pennispora]ORX67909.1 hypothetical protein DL89DRAFT_294447 [Linderina pennispora]